jgi:AraC-like DNA-binding protein
LNTLRDQVRTLEKEIQKEPLIMIKKTQTDLSEPRRRLANRRQFVRLAGVAGLGAMGGATLLDRAPKAMAANGINDFDILNFALNLEYLEANFYTVATTGKTLAQSGFDLDGSGNHGTVTGGMQVDFGGFTTVEQVAKELAFNEQSHVKDIRTMLAQFGVTPIAEPSINLDAPGIGFASVAQFLTLSRAFEDIGVTAYGGAIPLFLNKTILGAAARILAVEAEQSGNLRLLVAENGIATTALDHVDILPPPSGTQFFSDVHNPPIAQTEVRTPGQILWIAYGNKANAASGGFFPDGVNGVINMSTAEA